jgi:hypothetical protein
MQREFFKAHEDKEIYDCCMLVFFLFLGIVRLYDCISVFWYYKSSFQYFNFFRFHFDCVTKMATNAGYFFKCPMCNNKDEFEQEMKLFGVFIPEQDAVWEREGNVFEGMYERHGTCDAEECQCPDGREFDEDYTIWEIVSYFFNCLHFLMFVPVDVLRDSHKLLVTPNREF